MEAGFLAVDRRPLKARHDLHDVALIFMYGFSLSSYTARSSTRTIVARCPANGALRDAFPFPSRRSRPLRAKVRISVHGRWTNCRFVRWGVGRRMGPMCGSLDLTFDLYVTADGTLIKPPSKFIDLWSATKPGLGWLQCSDLALTRLLY